MLKTEDKEGSKNQRLSTLIHNCRSENGNPPWVKFGSAGWVNIQSALTQPAGPGLVGGCHGAAHLDTKDRRAASSNPWRSSTGSASWAGCCLK